MDNVLGLDEIKIATSSKKSPDKKVITLEVKGLKQAPSFNGICVLQSGHIILTECNSCKLILADCNFLVLDTFSLGATPTCLCSVDDSRVAVSLPKKRLVQVFNVGDNLALQSSLHINEDFTKIAGFENEIYVSRSDGMIYVCDFAGNSLRQINVHGNNSTYMCNDICISRDGQTVYAGYLLGGVIAYDKQKGQVLWQRDPDNLGTRLMCLGTAGEVFVCGQKKNCVLKFQGEEDGHSVFITENELPDLVTAICYDRNNSRLIVSFPNSNKLHVFEE